MTLDTCKNDVKTLASKIETLAKEVQSKLENNQDDILTVGNELVRNSMTFVFSLGELYHAKQVPTTVVKQKSNKIFKRDEKGRFCR